MIWYFLKFFELEEWADQFMAGRLYLNTLGFFKRMESASTAYRGDPTEAVSMWLQPSDVVMTLRVPALGLKTVITAKDLAAPIQASSVYHEQLHLLCLYAFHTEKPVIDAGTIQNIDSLHQQLRIDPKCFSMGKFAVMIPAVPFLERLRAELKHQNLAATGKLLKYYDDASFHGEIAASEIAFSKQQRFSYQREFRVCIDTRAANSAPLILNVGDMSAISTNLPATRFPRLNEMTIGVEIGPGVGQSNPT